MRRFVRTSRSVVAAAVVALLGGTLPVPATASPAAAVASDGPPVIEYTTPQVARTAGGTPVRISGTGFKGTTSVTFGGVPALDFKAVDSTLLTATVPPAAPGQDNTSVDVTVTDNEGSFTGTAANNTGMYYTDATINVTPSTGLNPDDPVTVTVAHYQPNAQGVILEFNPLVGFHEGGPQPGPLPPYLQPLFPPTATNGNGHLNQTRNLDPTYNADHAGYDPNDTCAPTQITADYGLPQCIIGFGQFATGTLERHITFAGNPVPAAPTLAVLSTTSVVHNGDTVSLAGVHWNNNAYFGSDTAQNDPGETRLKAQICNSDGTNCKFLSAMASVDPTQYQTSSTTTPIQGVFIGATLQGSFVVNNSGACRPNCLVKVSQEGYNYDAYNGQGTGMFITATAPLTVGN